MNSVNYEAVFLKAMDQNIAKQSLYNVAVGQLPAIIATIESCCNVVRDTDAWTFVFPAPTGHFIALRVEKDQAGITAMHIAVRKCDEAAREFVHGHKPHHSEQANASSGVSDTAPVPTWPEGGVL